MRRGANKNILILQWHQWTVVFSPNEQWSMASGMSSKGIHWSLKAPCPMNQDCKDGRHSLYWDDGRVSKCCAVMHFKWGTKESASGRFGPLIRVTSTYRCAWGNPKDKTLHETRKCIRPTSLVCRNGVHEKSNSIFLHNEPPKKRRHSLDGWRLWWKDNLTLGTGLLQMIHFDKSPQAHEITCVVIFFF